MTKNQKNILKEHADKYNLSISYRSTLYIYDEKRLIYHFDNYEDNERVFSNVLLFMAGYRAGIRHSVLAIKQIEDIMVFR